MRSGSPGSGLAAQLLGAALLLLLAAWALHAAVQLVVSVWRPLAVIGGLGLTGAAVVAWWRRRSGGW